MSDQHSRTLMGCYGHALVRTPNLDRLAARGTRFTECWTPSPVCIPARASFATGKYIHQIGFWDNADPYDGSVPSWHHRLREAGHQVVSIGKLHFRSDEDDCGFSESIIPMQVFEGKGDLLGLIRDDLPVRGAAYKMARMAGPGESPYTQYDRDIAARAQVWLRERAPQYTDKPWVLFVSFVSPHYPLTAPPEHFYHYFDDPNLPMPLFYERSQRPDHLFIRDYAKSFTLMTISKRRQIFAAPLPATTVSAALWMSRPARYSMHSLHQGSPTAPVLFTRATMETPSPNVGSGENRRSTKKPVESL